MILFLIDSLALAPVPGAYDANHIVPVSEPHGKNSSAHGSKTIEAFLRFAMRKITSDDALWIKKRPLGEAKADAVLLLVLRILVEIPFETDRHHRWLAPIWRNSHISIWAI